MDLFFYFSGRHKTQPSCMKLSAVDGAIYQILYIIFLNRKIFYNLSGVSIFLYVFYSSEIIELCYSAKQQFKVHFTNIKEFHST